MTTPPWLAVVYDEETYPNFFSVVVYDLWSDARVQFEISDRRDDSRALYDYVNQLRRYGVSMIGFNNLGFDYPILHFFMQTQGTATYQQLYEKAQSIIMSNDRFGHMIWPSDRLIPQIDVYKIHHFDNQARRTSLKALQFNMRSPSVEDLPFPVGTILTDEQKNVTLAYNHHDVAETKEFTLKSMDMIEFRRELTAKYERDFMNHNDTKIGKDYFIMQLGNDMCFERVNGRKEPRQTFRPYIDLGDVVFPYIHFHTPELAHTLQWFKSQRITETKGVFTGLSATHNGFTFQFGVGGIHGSVENRIVRSDATHVVIDLDVASYYPNLAIANRLFPAHLSEQFCDIYKDVYDQRKGYAKGTAENKMLKLALNGVYGDSNNIYSPFYDPQYTMSITINGQLLLCMLAEWLMLHVSGLEMIQVNTDGLSVRVPRGAAEDALTAVTQQWEAYTCLQLERADYDLMAIRDVNNYMAVYTDGKIKRKGAYQTEYGNDEWHKDQSSVVVAKAASAALKDGVPPETYIRCHADPFDFMIREKATGKTKLYLGDQPVQKTFRFYVAKDGAALTKVMTPPPGCIEGNYKRANSTTKVDYMAWHKANGNVWNKDIHTGNQSRYESRRIGVCKGWDVADCCKVDDFNWSNLNYDWYIQEAKKLVDPLQGTSH